jgi:hypothetical protein
MMFVIVGLTKMIREGNIIIHGYNISIINDQSENKKQPQKTKPKRNWPKTQTADIKQKSGQKRRCLFCVKCDHDHVNVNEFEYIIPHSF